MRHLYFIIAVFVLQSCSSTVDCANDHVAGTIRFKGFDTALLARVVVKRYIRNDNYRGLLETTEYKIDSPLYDTRAYDASHGYSHWPFIVAVNAACDWIVEVPSVGKAYRISGMTSTSETQKVGFSTGYSSSDICYDVATGYYLDDVYHATGLTVKPPGRSPDELDIVLQR